MNIIRKKKNSQKGFSLIELLLVLGIASIAFVGIINYISRYSDQQKATNAGLQFQEVAQALGNYITREATTISACMAVNTSITIPVTTLTNSAGTTTVGACVLNNRQLLPSTFVQTNSLFNVAYSVLIQKNATGSLGGLVITSGPVKDAGGTASGKIRYDWIGMAMKAAGPQSGMTFTTATQMVGLGGGWALTNADFAQINQKGLFGVRTIYQGNYDDIYLRLDGEYPMRGDLNMGNYSITNATDVNFNGWLNGNNALLNNIQSGYINNAGNLNTATATVASTIDTGGRQALAMPAGWGGDHVHTWDLYANGTIGVGTNGSLAAYMSNNGMIYSSYYVQANDVLLTGTYGASGRNPQSFWLTDRLPQYVSRGAAVVTDGVGVGYPSCPGGAPRIILTPQIQNTYGAYDVQVQLVPQANNSYNVYVYRTPYTYGQIQVYATYVAGGWQVHLATTGGGASGVYALAQVFCDYGN